MSKRKVGRKELLTLEVANSIGKMIERMPDAGVPVNWENVMAQCKKKFGYSFTRQMLSQKRWDGRKLLAEKFSEAKSIQRRMQSDAAPKYKTASRPALQKRIAEQDAKILALQEELEKVRAHQFDSLDTFLNTRLDLREILEKSLSKD